LAVSDYGTLKTEIGLYLNRSDLSAYIPNFIANAARRIHYGSDAPFSSEPVRIPAMQARATGTISSSAISFPTRFIEPIRLVGVSGTVKWQIDGTDKETFTKLSNSADLPSVYSYLNNQIEVAGTQSCDYVLDYYQAFAAFSADGDTNTLLTTAPDVYVFGALLESAPFIADIPMVNGWYGMFKSIVSSLNRRTKHSGGLRVRAN
jgi:hypothetical protein